MTWQKDDADKPRLTLLPRRALGVVASVMEHGARKYGADNWERAPSLVPYVNAALRHLFEQGEHDTPVLDDDSALPVLAHAAASALIALELALRRDETEQDAVTMMAAAPKRERPRW